MVLGTAGTLPPCGHACQATVLIDEGLQQSPGLLTCQTASSGQHAEGSTQAESQLPPSAHSRAALQPQEHSHLHSVLGSGSPPPSQAGLQCGSIDEHVADSMADNTIQEGPCLQSQAAAGDGLLYCGAGLPNAYLAVTFSQLLRLSKGQAVDLAQSTAPLAGAHVHL